ncbi:arsenic resistance protein [Paramicrobacterium fandaimingii]|uniref:arsenic resistance protein n=1 Tax=Paramicrobacterium fandaimingii TaxID=2708079 RepID=UPI0014247CC2|nr:bile acid:sodium symporter [Microbacterium fandaimingii]
MGGVVAGLERYQVTLYIAAILCAAALGFGLPEIGLWLGPLITPSLAVLMYVTFLSVPVAAVGAGLRDWRFLLAVGGVNFVIVPIVVFVISRIIASNEPLFIGVLLVLLSPCVDYVIVFARVAGGSANKLLAVTPILLVLQMAFLPLYLGAMAGPALLAGLAARPFVEAFLLLIVVPFGMAALTQVASRTRVGGGLRHLGNAVMVPCMMLVLIVVVASHIAGVGSRIIELAAVVPVYVLFIAVLVGVGAIVGRLLHMSQLDRRALIFSGVTRNSLVVLPFALALPAHLDLAPLAVVMQTLVELIAMVILVRLVPRVA